MPNWERDEYEEHVGDRFEEERCAYYQGRDETMDDWSPADREDELGIGREEEEECDD